MGWNRGYGIFEATVIGAYNLGKLDKDLLRVLMEPYRGSDIDAGGKQGLLAHDGLEVEEVVLKVWGLPIPAKPDLENCSDDEAEDYYEALGTAFNKITRDEFDWC